MADLDPRKRDKSPQPIRSVDMLGGNRAYTMGQKLKARQMFVFNEDGTIKGLMDVPDKNKTPTGG